MPGMIKRWLRRRLAPDYTANETSLDDEDRARGAVVRRGRLVTLRRHVPANREPFQRWYADQEIAGLLRHDLEPLSAAQSRSYFDTFILPASARGICFAIHERTSKRLIGTTALTDEVDGRTGKSALFRIVIGEKDCWGKGYGTQATQLVAAEAFETLGLDEVRLEVFSHNARAIAAYRRVGFVQTGEHVEWVPRKKTELRVIEMHLTPETLAQHRQRRPVASASEERQRRRREERTAARARRNDARRAARRQARVEARAQPAEERDSAPDAD
jgi:RimJ/RimL family protein N-acetyltransferase